VSNTLLLGWEPPLAPDQITPTFNQKTEDYVAKFQKNCLMAILALNKVAFKHIPTIGNYKQGQHVWLEGKNLPLSHGTIKLSPKQYGPFTIMKLISPVASQLSLPMSWNIHPVFHNSLLTPFVKTSAHGPNFTRPPPCYDLLFLFSFSMTQQTHVTVYYYFLTRSCDSLVQIRTDDSLLYI
jgi:hypothetical protein